jgi:hypothetical protein
VRRIVGSFPRAEEDSGEHAVDTLRDAIPKKDGEARDLVGEKTRLPRSLVDGWLVPGADRTTRLYVAPKDAITKSQPAGPGFRLYEAGEPGMRTVFQQLPGRGVRFYKVMDRHLGPPGRPTVLSLPLKRGCTGWAFFRTCAGKWQVDDRHTFLGTEGVLLRKEDGTPVGFLTAPAARDAHGRPVRTRWRLVRGTAPDTDTVQITVDDLRSGAYPIVVDPQWVYGRWLRPAALALRGAGRSSTGPVQVALKVGACAVSIYLDWPQTAGQPWYRRVWREALVCLAATL